MAQRTKRESVDKQSVIEALANPKFRSMKSISNETGVPSRTIYNWLSDNDFKAKVNEEIEKYTDSELGNIWKALIEKCSTGDVSAIKLYFELKGKYKQQIDVSGNITFVDDVNE